MIKRYCDICGKEVKKVNEIWQFKLYARENNPRVSFDETIEEICEECATRIHCTVSMMRNDLDPINAVNGMTVAEYNNEFLPKIDTASAFINGLRHAIEKTDDVEGCKTQLKCIGWSVECRETIATALDYYNKAVRKRLKLEMEVI